MIEFMNIYTIIILLNLLLPKLFYEKSLISGKRGAFWIQKIEHFLENRGLLKVKVSEKRGNFSMWRTLTGHIYFQ